MEGKSYKPFNALKEVRAPISGAFFYGRSNDGLDNEQLPLSGGFLFLEK